MSTELGTDLVVGSWADTPQSMQTSNVTDPEDWLIEAFGGGSTQSGVSVNSQTVLSSGPVYQAITLISDALAEMPIEVYKDDAPKGQADKNHPIHRIWNEVGNEHMLPFHVRQTLQGHMLLYGNGIGVIEWVSGKPVGVYPMPHGSVTPYLVPYSADMEEIGMAGEVIYFVTTPSGYTDTLFKEEVFHLKMYGSGLWGQSPLHLFRDMFGNGMAMEAFQGFNFGNAARPSGVLEKQFGEGIPTKLSPEARANLRREWSEIHSGLNNTGKIAVLQDGLTWKPMSVNAQDAAMIESMKYYREQVAAIYKIPPHKLGSLENSAVRANIEEQNRSFVQETLRPHATVWEQECLWKLTTAREKVRRKTTVRMNFQELLRADLATRYNSYATARQWGWLSVNDIRKLEKLEEIEAGDEYLRPLNMINVEVGQELDQQQVERGETLNANLAEPAEDTEEQFLAYARDKLTQIFGIELNNLRRGMKSKKPFREFAEDYYSRFPEYLAAELQPLSNVNGFVSSTELNGLVEEYVSESFELVRHARTDVQLTEAFVGGQRVDSFLSKMRCKP